MSDSSKAFWDVARLIGLLTFLAYVYSFGYLFRIEPKFIPAFSLLDLILWAATSLTAVVTILFIVSLAVLPFIGLIHIATARAMLTPYQRIKALRRAQGAIHVSAVVVPLTVLFIVLAATETPSPQKPLLALIPLLSLPFLGALLFVFLLHRTLLRVSLRFWRRMTFCLVVLLVFVFGDYQAVRTAYWETPTSRACVLRPAPACDGVVFLGSSGFIARRGSAFILVPKDRDQWFFSPGAPAYIGNRVSN